jgi:hypothetical protein
VIAIFESKPKKKSDTVDKPCWLTYHNRTSSAAGKGRCERRTTETRHRGKGCSGERSRLLHTLIMSSHAAGHNHRSTVVGEYAFANLWESDRSPPDLEEHTWHSGRRRHRPYGWPRGFDQGDVELQEGLPSLGVRAPY